MRYKWLNHKDNHKLIVFFNGWGMDECVVKHLECEDYNVLMFYDYNTLDNNFDFKILKKYSDKNVIAWSMGVMIGGKYISERLLSTTHTVAINGTLKPIDVEFGIHPKIYDLTIKGFDEKGRDRFISSMFEEKTEISCQRNIKEQQSELIALKNLASSLNTIYKENTPLFNKVLISDNDKIIPTKSQINFWRIEPNLKGGHCPFFQISKWSELL